MKNSSNILHFLQYADDSTTTYSSNDLNNSLATIKIECNKVLDWLLANRLIINLKKTFLMVFTNRKRPTENLWTLRTKLLKKSKNVNFWA